MHLALILNEIVTVFCMGFIGSELCRDSDVCERRSFHVVFYDVPRNNLLGVPEGVRVSTHKRWAGQSHRSILTSALRS